MTIELSDKELRDIILALQESRNFFYWKKEELDALCDKFMGYLA